MKYKDWDYWFIILTGKWVTARYAKGERISKFVTKDSEQDILDYIHDHDLAVIARVAKRVGKEGTDKFLKNLGIEQ